MPFLELMHHMASRAKKVGFRKETLFIGDIQNYKVVLRLSFQMRPTVTAQIPMGFDKTRHLINNKGMRSTQD